MVTVCKGQHKQRAIAVPTLTEKWSAPLSPTTIKFLLSWWPLYRPYRLESQYVFNPQKKTARWILLLSLFHRRRNWVSKRLTAVCSSFLIYKSGDDNITDLGGFHEQTETFSTGLSTEWVLSNCSFLLLLLSMEFRARFNDQLFPDSSVGKDRQQCRRPWSDSWVEKIRWRKDRLPIPIFLGFPVAHLVKNPPAMQETWVGKIPWRRRRLLTPVFWPGEFHGLYSQWGHKELDTTEQLSVSFS